MESLTLQPIARVDGTINLPGSKSVSNRALLLAALAGEHPLRDIEQIRPAAFTLSSQPGQR